MFPWKDPMGSLINLRPPPPPRGEAPTRPGFQPHMLRHNQALQFPRGIEHAIVALRNGLLQYGQQYSQRYEGCELGKDGVLGQGWLDMARGYLALLNGECGRFDCGTLDGELRSWALQFGFEEEL